VLSTGARHLVFLKQGDGPFQPREVVIGVSTPERIQILRGLSPGDSVVASATFLLDAESNLGTLLGGMGDMPGMDVGPLKKPAPPAARPDSREHDDHGGHD
jgi:Cu(I)/Ag(I) efflux system membrane fusion protein